MNWLSGLDPNAVIGVLGLLSTVGGWLWDKARGRKTESFTATISHAVDNFVVELLGNAPSDDALVIEGYVEGYMQRERLHIEKRLWPVLTKRGIPRNALSERLVHEAVEEATARLGREIVERRERALAARKDKKS